MRRYLWMIITFRVFITRTDKYSPIFTGSREVGLIIDKVYILNIFNIHYFSLLRGFGGSNGWIFFRYKCWTISDGQTVSQLITNRLTRDSISTVSISLGAGDRTHHATPKPLLATKSVEFCLQFVLEKDGEDAEDGEHHEQGHGLGSDRVHGGGQLLQGCPGLNEYKGRWSYSKKGADPEW